MRNLNVALVLGGLAMYGCGGGGGNQASSAGSTTAAAPPAAGATTGAAAAAAKPATGKTWQVKMYGDATGSRYDPANLTIKAGDAITFTVVNGVPHNVAFWPDSIPSGASAQLSGNMSQQSSPLAGPFLTANGQSYTISFAGVPAGVYKFYCTPHLALGMKGVLTIQ